VIPIGSYQKDFGVTLSLPSVLGRRGIIEVLESADTLKEALDHARKS
jgi:hypothetical protein